MGPGVFEGRSCRGLGVEDGAVEDVAVSLAVADLSLVAEGRVVVGGSCRFVIAEGCVLNLGVLGGRSRGALLNNRLVAYRPPIVLNVAAQIYLVVEPCAL